MKWVYCMCIRRTIECRNSVLETFRVYSDNWVYSSTHGGTDHPIMGIGLWSINGRSRVLLFNDILQVYILFQLMNCDESHI
jgi:hypothetical protein